MAGTSASPAAGTLAASVSREQVAGLLAGRAPAVLTDPTRAAQFDAVVAGTAAEVADVVGDPPPPQLAALAGWCVALGVAASLEGALFPEQQLGDDGAASTLRIRFLAVKAQLAANPGAARRARAVGSFPPPAPWPDDHGGRSPSPGAQRYAGDTGARW